MTKLRYLFLAVVFVFASVNSAVAQIKSSADLAKYRGADREELLKAGAKKEAKFIYYTTLSYYF